MIQFINAIATLMIVGAFALCVDGKHIQQETVTVHQRDVVAEYAALPDQKPTYGLTEHQAIFLAALAKHMGRAR